MSACIFCNIVQGKSEASIVYQNDRVVAFEDIHPRAPVHILIVPRKHIPTLNDIAEADKELIGELFWVAKQLAQNHGLADRGYRTIFNCNREAGQEVYHLHLHLLGGRYLSWPPR